MKRSAQYKKKHGLGENESAQKTGKVKNQECRKPQKKSNSPPTPSQSVRIGKEGIAKENRPAVGAELHAEESEQDRYFSHRGIESNWERYDLLPDSDKGPELAANNFDLMLESASNALSRFRFKEEQEWEAELEAYPSDPSSLLSIDASKLASVLRCVPLHERLGIEASVFEATQIDQFNADAARSKVALQQNDDQPISKVPSPEVVAEIEKPQICNPAPCAKDSDADDVLDDLLGCESSLSVVINEMEDNELEALLNSSEPPEITTKSEELNFLNDDVKIVPHVVSAPESTDLEDWLDSVLDD
ncbi:hypothetical protein CAPTEDRAFT_226499 [Capitella teleta]|uniref:Cell death regulator Aven n=1 Tax=Capitella teleta TaxID=283909 RepID=R7TJD6_CAPTE|nr:hypothetical protein CAPTEDRAFT_226499 [Capitella teleta]|eukprot:ELT91220.1 hypothetical protein CAPTEDRAFT_226499 [Capitella teleta]